MVSFGLMGRKHLSSARKKSTPRRRNKSTPKVHLQAPTKLPTPPSEDEKLDEKSQMEKEEKFVAHQSPPIQAEHSDVDEASSPEREGAEKDDDDSRSEQQQQPLCEQRENPGAVIAISLPEAIPKEAERQPEHEHCSQFVTAPDENSKEKIEEHWTDSMQVTLLKRMVDYLQQKGLRKISKDNVADFRSLLEGCSLHELPDDQILIKVRDVEKNHDGMTGDMHDLSKVLGCPAEEGSCEKRMDDGDNDEGSCKKRRMDDGDNDAVEGAGGWLKGQISSWENAIMTKAREKLDWSEEVTRHKMASMETTVRDLMMNNWIKEREVSDKAIMKLTKVEGDHVKFFF